MPYIGNIVQDFSVSTAMLNTDSVTSIKVLDGTIVNADINASAAIAGTKISPDFGSQAIVTTGAITGQDFRTASSQTFFLTSGDDWNFRTITGSTKLTITNTGQVDFAGNVDCNAGLDVTGDITATGDLTVTGGDVIIQGVEAKLHLTDTNNDDDYLVFNNNGTFKVYDATNNADRLQINSSGVVTIGGNTDFGDGIDVTGNITTTSGNLTVDGEGSVEDVFKISDQAGGQRLLMGNRDSAGVDCPRIFNVGNAALTIGIGDSWSGDGGTLTNHFGVAKNGTITSYGNHDFSAGIDVSGAITGTGDLTIDTNTLHVDSSNNQVGIGTTSPGQKLGVAGNIRFESADPTLEFNNGGAMVYARAANTLQFATGGGPSSPQEKMQIDSSGNLLHGVTSSEDTTGNSGTKLITAGDLQIDGDQKALVFRSTASTAQKQSGIQWWNENGAGVQCAIFGIREAVSKAPSSLAFYTSDDVDTTANSGEGDITERMRIDSDGTIFSFSPNDTTPNIKWRSDDTNWFGSLNQSVEGSTISTFLAVAGDWSANGSTYSATKNFNGSFETRAIALHPQFNGGAGKVSFLQKAGGSSTTDGTVTEILKIDNDGIKFGTDTAASNALDDYEEGTYTPALLGSTTNPTVNYTNQQGRYTKIGNLIYATFDLTYDSKSADGSGILYVSLPLNVNGASVFHIAHLRGSRCSAFPTTVTKFAATHAIIPGTNFFEPNTNDGSGGFGVIQGSNLNSSGRVVGGAVYLAA